MSQWTEEKKTVLEAALKMVAAGLVVETSGNISLRLCGERPLIAITPSSRHYDTLTPDDIQVVDFSGEKVEGNLRPSIETPLHIGIYRARKDVNAIVHTHSVYATAAAVAGREIPPILEDQVAGLGGEIKLARYASSGSAGLTAAVLEALDDRSGVLLASHGALGTGRSMRDAFTAAELIEKSAKVYLLALAAGKVNRLSEQAVETLRSIYDNARSEV